MNNQQPHVLVTRPEGQSDGLVEALTLNNFKVFRLPMLEIVPNADLAMYETMLSSIKSKKLGVDIAVFISTNAVKYTAELMQRYKIASLASYSVGVGHATTEAIVSQGWKLLECEREDRVTAIENSEALLSEGWAQASAVWERTILVCKGVGGRQLIADEFAARGAKVVLLESYRRKAPEYIAATISKEMDDFLFRDRQKNQHSPIAYKKCYIIVISVETLKNFEHAINSYEAKEAVREVNLIVPSERVALEANMYGYKNVFVANNASKESIVSTLNALKN